MSITITKTAGIPVRRDGQQSITVALGGIGGGGSPGDAQGGAGATAHASLSQLDYASAGHTGFAPIADPTFTGEIGIGAVNVSETELGILEGLTTTTARLNYLTSAGGTTGTTSANIVFSDNPTFTTKITSPLLKITTDAGVGKMFVCDADGDAIWTTSTGTGAPVRADSPTFTTKLTSPVIDVGIQSTTAGIINIYEGATGDDYMSISAVGDNSFLVDMVGTSSIGTLEFRDFNVNISGGYIREPNYTSGFQGTNWKIQADGDAEFENMFIRGGLTVSELIINQLHYQNGGLIIGAGAGRVATIEDATQGAEILTFEDPEGNGIIPFTVGAIVKIQKVDIDRTTVVRVLVRQVSDADASDYTIELIPTAGWVPADDDVGVFEVGDEVVAIGHTTNTNLDSSIYMSATDTDNPFLRVLDVVDSYADWTTAGASLKLQLGNLASLANYDDGTLVMPADPGYGLYSSNVYLSGTIYASAGEIGGWTIGATYIRDTAGTVGMSSAVTGGDDIRFWAGHATMASAPFRVTEAGTLTATGIAELGTNAVTDGSYTQNIAMVGGEIRENSRDDDHGILYINYHGYDGGDTRLRETYIGDGQGNALLVVGGANSDITTQATLNVHYGLLINFNNFDLGEGLIFSNWGGWVEAMDIPQLVNKAASVNIRNSHDAEVNSAVEAYTKVKTITLTHGLVGEQRFLFDIKYVSGGADPESYAKIYRNGVALGSQQTASTSYVTKSEDITQDWVAGDTCELWVDAYHATTYAENFRIAYDDSPTVTVASVNS